MEEQPKITSEQMYNMAKYYLSLAEALPPKEKVKVYYSHPNYRSLYEGRSDAHGTCQFAQTAECYIQPDTFERLCRCYVSYAQLFATTAETLNNIQSSIREFCINAVRANAECDLLDSERDAIALEIADSITQTINQSMLLHRNVSPWTHFSLRKVDNKQAPFDKVTI
jgi:hypothetical protein